MNAKTMLRLTLVTMVGFVFLVCVWALLAYFLEDGSPAATPGQAGATEQTETNPEKPGLTKQLLTKADDWALQQEKPENRRFWGWVQTGILFGLPIYLGLALVILLVAGLARLLGIIKG